MYTNIRTAVANAVASSSAVPADFNTEVFMAEFREDIQDTQTANSLLERLEFMQANSEGAKPELLVAMANEVTKALPELALTDSSMESYDLTMEGIGDIVTAVRDYIVNKFKKMGERISKFFKGVAYVFKGMEAQLDELEARLDNDKYKLVEGDVKIPASALSGMISDGKLLPLLEGWKNIGDYTDKFIDGAPVDKALKTLTSKRWTSMGDGLDLVTKAINDLIKDLKLTEKGAKRVFVKIPKGLSAYGSEIPLPKDSSIIVMTESRKSEDGKKEYALPFDTKMFHAASSAVNRTKVTTMPALTRDECVELIKIARENLGSMSKAVQALETMYHAEDDYIGALFSNDPSSSLTKKELNSLLNYSHNIYITAYNCGFYGTDMVNTHVSTTETMLKACVK